MEQVIKQRLLGVVVVLALVAILFPFLTGEDPGGDLLTEHIPPRPAVPVERVADPKPLYPGGQAGLAERLAWQAQAPASRDELRPSLRGPQTRVADPDTDNPNTGSKVPIDGQAGLGFDAQGLPKAWALQLASFNRADNAKRLQARLLEKGYKAYVKQVEGYSRVFIGPELRQARLEQLRETLKREFDLKGLLVRFEP